MVSALALGCHPRVFVELAWHMCLLEQVLHPQILLHVGFRHDLIPTRKFVFFADLASSNMLRGSYLVSYLVDVWYHLLGRKTHFLFWQYLWPNVLLSG